MEGYLRSSRWEDLCARVGSEIGASPWIEIDQPMINAFADLTGDHYFIHIDPERAAALPFKSTIAHGFLTLALLAQMSYHVCPRIEEARFPLNYGFNRLRFVHHVSVGSRVRGRFVLRSAEKIDANQFQATYEVTIEIEGQTKPALVAEWVLRAMA